MSCENLNIYEISSIGNGNFTSFPAPIQDCPCDNSEISNEYLNIHYFYNKNLFGRLNQLVTYSTSETYSLFGESKIDINIDAFGNIISEAKYYPTEKARLSLKIQSQNGTSETIGLLNICENKGLEPPCNIMPIMSSKNNPCCWLEPLGFIVCSSLCPDSLTYAGFLSVFFSRSVQDASCNSRSWKWNFDGEFLGKETFLLPLDANKKLNYYRLQANKLLDLKETNQKHGVSKSRCGNGSKDDCWSSAGSFTPYLHNGCDKNFNSIKVRVGGEISQNSIVEGTAFAYFNNDGSNSPSPCCCLDCFNGTIVRSANFTISESSPIFEHSNPSIDGQKYSSVFEINNDDSDIHGKNIYFCTKINKTTYL